MYEIADLFDKRCVIGTKLEQVLNEKKYTKAELCKKSGVSRPTLDKLLAGTLTSKTNYEKHISKILDCLLLTPDMLIGNVTNEYSRTRQIKNILKISSEQIVEATGISLARLTEIEAGNNATIAELRDIALCLSVSVNCLLGSNFFEPQIATLDDFIKYNEYNQVEKLSGFWGHIGILLNNRNDFLWFPITGNVRKLIYNMMNNEQMVIPCMNNKVLLLNMQNVNEIILLDEACDQPEFVNWDYNVSSGEFPLVIYEALEDYLYCEETEIGLDGSLSCKFKDLLDELMQKEGWTEESILEMIEFSYIYYMDGKVRTINIDFEQNETITDVLSCIYDFGDDGISSNILYCDDINAAEVIINLKNVSMLEMPLVKVEKAIFNSKV